MILAEVAGEVANTIPGPTWMYGVAAVGILVAALYVITRINPFR